MTKSLTAPLFGMFILIGMVVVAWNSWVQGGAPHRAAAAITQAMPVVSMQQQPVVKHEVEVEGVALSAAHVQSINETFWSSIGPEVEMVGFEGFEVFLFGEFEAPITATGQPGFAEAAEAAFANGQVRTISVATPDGQVVRLPDFDEDALSHAIESRGSLLKVMLVYELLQFQPLGLYCGTASGTCLVHANDRQIGDVVGVFINGGSSSVPQLLRPVSIIFRSRGVSLDAVRASSCASWKVFPNLEFHAQFEPPPTGFGTCLENGNIHSS